MATTGGIRIRDACTVVLDSSSIMNNSSNVGSSGSFDGGGVYVTGDVTMNFYDLIFESNHANDRGGGLYLGSAFTMNLDRLLIKNNTSNAGGGIHVQNSGDVIPAGRDATILISYDAIFGEDVKIGGILGIIDASITNNTNSIINI